MCDNLLLKFVQYSQNNYSRQHNYLHQHNHHYHHHHHHQAHHHYYHHNRLHQSQRMAFSFSFVILIFVVITLSSSSILVAGEPPQCGLYGAPPCLYVPAPPGATPPCATPGKTYCEHAPQYPLKIINNLIIKYGYDIKKLLVDETGEEFESVSRPRGQYLAPAFHHNKPTFVNTNHNHNNNNNNFNKNHGTNVNKNNNGGGGETEEGYQYPKPNTNYQPSTIKGYEYNAPNQLYGKGGNSNNNYYNIKESPEPIYIPRPPSYQSPPPQPVSTSNKNNNYYYQPSHHNYNSQSLSSNQQQGYNNKAYVQHPQRNYYFEQQHITEYNPAEIFRRFTRDLSKKQNISTINSEINIFDNINIDTDDENTELLFLNSFISSNNKTRIKRQSFDRNALCDVRTQFVTPQAALNNRGNWMYVINQDDTARQLVKTEVCASTVCSNLCQLPNTYNSRCEQKFIQKRLIALNANGQNFYTDTFWFPSCCVCTISNQ